MMGMRTYHPPTMQTGKFLDQFQGFMIDNDYDYMSDLDGIKDQHNNVSDHIMSLYTCLPILSAAPKHKEKSSSRLSSLSLSTSSSPSSENNETIKNVSTEKSDVKVDEQKMCSTEAREKSSSSSENNKTDGTNLGNNSDEEEPILPRRMCDGERVSTSK